MKANNDQDLNLINYNISKPLHDQTSLIDSEEGQDVNKLIKTNTKPLSEPVRLGILIRKDTFGPKSLETTT